MARLLDLLYNGDTEAKEMATCAISAVAESAGKAFMPYFPSILEVMKQCMSQVKMIQYFFGHHLILSTFSYYKEREEYLNLRCRATECVGVVALAVGKEAFKVINIQLYCIDAIHITHLPNHNPNEICSPQWSNLCT